MKIKACQLLRSKILLFSILFLIGCTSNYSSLLCSHIRAIVPEGESDIFVQDETCYVIEYNMTSEGSYLFECSSHLGFRTARVLLKEEYNATHTEEWIEDRLPPACDITVYGVEE